MTRAFVNGCFDVLHVGHLRMLEFAAGFGPLTVAINSDRSIRKLKGERRPYNSANDRAEMLYSMRCVHNVIVFDYETPVELLHILYSEECGPTHVIKGSEYAIGKLPERSIIEANGGQIIFFNRVPNHSSTRLIECLES